MAQRTQIVAELKRALRERGITYPVVAKKLDLSVASVKRLFSTEDFSLQRIDAICDLLDIEFSELIEKLQSRTLSVKKLTLAQENEIVSDAKLFLVTWLVLNRTPAEEISRDYAFTEREVQRFLIKLDRLKVIELQPKNKVRLLVSQHFSWRPGGPVQNYIHQKLLKEFLAARFLGEREEFFFHGGSISEHGLTLLKRALLNASRECVEIMQTDQSVETKRTSAAFVLALRPWRYSGFAQFQRNE